jgi:sentrin-specific protease 7
MMTYCKSTDRFDAIKKWTIKVEIFNKNFIVIPINIENSHWYMAILCYPGRAIIKHTDPTAPPIVDNDNQKVILECKAARSDNQNKKAKQVDQEYVFWNS